MAKTLIQVQFDLDHAQQEYLALCEKAASAVAAAEGIHSKLWWTDEERGRAGGVYVFEDRQTACRYLDGPIITALRRRPFVKNFEARMADVQVNLSERTGYAFGGSARASGPRKGPAGEGP